MNRIPTLRRLAANDSYTFLMKELEKVDETILEPLSGTDWPRDLPVITGGGLIESVASIDVTYASTGQEDDNLFFDAANDIPVIQADMSKQVARTFNFAEYMAFNVMEREKMLSIGLTLRLCTTHVSRTISAVKAKTRYVLVTSMSPNW